MTCANPVCGHNESMHPPGGCIAIDRRDTPWRGMRPLFCPCDEFVRPAGTREPLMRQLDAVIESRTKKS